MHAIIWVCWTLSNTVYHFNSQLSHIGLDKGKRLEANSSVFSQYVPLAVAVAVDGSICCSYTHSCFQSKTTTIFSYLIDLFKNMQMYHIWTKPSGIDLEFHFLYIFTTYAKYNPLSACGCRSLSDTNSQCCRCRPRSRPCHAPGRSPWVGSARADIPSHSLVRPPRWKSEWSSLRGREVGGNRRWIFNNKSAKEMRVNRFSLDTHYAAPKQRSQGWFLCLQHCFMLEIPHKILPWL